MVAAFLLHFLLLRQDDKLPPVIDRLDCPHEVMVPMEPSARQAPTLKVEIGGKDYRFALDTGAQGGRISPDIVKSLGLNPVAQVLAGDPSGKNTRTVNIYVIPEIKIGDAVLHGVRMFADDGVVQKSSPAYFDGVMGYGVFHDVLLTLDYPNKQVILSPRSMNDDEAKASVPYQLEHGLPLLTVRVGDVKVDGHVDSGADGGLSIPSKYQSQLHLDGEPHKVGEARTLFNTVEIYAAKVKDPILVGGVKMPIDEVELNDLLPFANIGGRLLHKFKVVIDQKSQRIAFLSPT